MFVTEEAILPHPAEEADPATLTSDQLEAELAAQAARVDAGLARLLELVAESARRPGWHAGATTFAAWLAWRCSLLPRQAREHERIARRLSELPLIRAAFARGELSYAKVGALTRVAEPESQENLLELAEVLTASQLERAVGAFRRLTREQSAERQEREFLHWCWTEEGSLALRGLLPPEDGAVLLEALEAARNAVRERRRGEPADAETVSEPPPEEPGVTNAEALVALADLALARRDGDRSGGERHQVVVHVEARTLAGGGDGRCELADGRPLAVETARRLSCDGSLVELHERAGQTLSLGRKRRTVSPPLRRALLARDRGCRFPGCERTRFVDAHHVRHWSRGGETSLENLVSLCRRHHRLVHEGGYSLELLDDGEVRFGNQHGAAIPSVPRSPPTGPDALHGRLRRLGLEIDAATTRNGTGDRMELARAADAIAGAAAA